MESSPERDPRFKAVLFDQDDLRLEQIHPKVTFSIHSFTLCLSSDIPESWLGDEIRLSTGFRIPLKKHLTARSGTLPEDDLNIRGPLLRMKSKLIYALAETLNSTKLYWYLNEVCNSNRTYRDYEFVLYFDQFPLRTSLPFKEFFEKASETGILLLSSRGIEIGPRWWLRECLRDVWELEMNSPEKILLEGSQTGDLYLFQANSQILGQEDIEEILHDLTSRIIGFIQLGRYPRKTPSRLIQNRLLQPLKSGQWEGPSEDFLSLRATYFLSNLRELFWFLFLLMFGPTYPFLERELQIWIKPSMIQILFETEYLPDFLRVKTASRVIGRELLGEISVFYVPPETSQTILAFYDSEHGIPTWISADIPVPGFIIRETPSSFDLETRIRLDPIP